MRNCQLQKKWAIAGMIVAAALTVRGARAQECNVLTNLIVQRCYTPNGSTFPYYSLTQPLACGPNRTEARRLAASQFPGCLGNGAWCCENDENSSSSSSGAGCACSQPQPPAPVRADGRGPWSAFALSANNVVGLGAHLPNLQAAAVAALKDCQARRGTDCKLQSTTTDPCVAAAASITPNSFWIGYGGGSNTTMAAANATKYCQATAAPAGTCRVVVSACLGPSLNVSELKLPPDIKPVPTIKPSSGCSIEPVGLIRDRWLELDGAKGPLGCPRAAERAVGTGRARATAFANGEAVWSPQNGDRMVVAAYQQEDNIVVSWGDTSPKRYKKFLVRWSREGLHGQADVTEYIDGNRGFYAIGKPVPGRYSVIVKGCNGTNCEPSWSEPAEVVIHPLAAPAYPSCKSQVRPFGLIGARWAALGGAEGHLGCPLAPERAIPGRRGAIQSFANGEIAFSPDQGHGLTVAAFMENDRKLVFNWDDTSPYTYDTILLRLDKDGKNITQREFDWSRSGGWSWDIDGPGRYSVIIEGSKGRKRDQSWTIPVSALAPIPRPSAGMPPLPSADPNAGCPIQPGGLIRRHWAERLGGKNGSLGCPTGPETAVAGRSGRTMKFERGEIAWSPDNGTDLTVAVYQAFDRINIDWGQSKSFTPPKVLVRATWDGIDIGQDEVRTREIRGYSIKSKRIEEEGDNENQLVTYRGPGRYTVVIKGCDGARCQPAWSIGASVLYRTPADFVLPGLQPPVNAADALRDKPARSKAAIDALLRDGRDMEAEWKEDETRLGLAMLAVVADQVRSEKSPDSLRRHGKRLTYLGEINNGIRRATVFANVGTSACGLEGEYDTALKAYIPILYKFRQYLAPDVRYRLLFLLNKRGPYNPRDGRFICRGVVNIPETENHRWMIDSSKFLTNQLWHKRTGDRQYDNSLNGMRQHVLQRLVEHLQKDFIEYNSRPYARYTWAAIQNLYDYSQDDDVRIAAQSVLDYWSAHAAVYTNDGRANPPYRRRGSHNRSDLYHAEADRTKKRFLVYTAPSYSSEELLPAYGIEEFASTEMLLASLTNYAPPSWILDLMVNHDQRSFFQAMNYETREFYASERDFLISGGGTASRYAYKVAGFGDDDDLGVAHPTALIPTGAQTSLERLIRFDEPHRIGSVYQSGSCVAPGFACGLRPTIPGLYLRPGCHIRDGLWTFIDYSSRQCREPRTDKFGFYAAVYGAGKNWGFLEAVSRSTLGTVTLREFARQTLARNAGRSFALDRENGYADWGGREIRFNLRLEVPVIKTGRPDVDAFIRNRSVYHLAYGHIINSSPRNAAPGPLTIRNPVAKRELRIVFKPDGTVGRTEQPYVPAGN